METNSFLNIVSIIVTGIVHRHGGRVWAKREVGKGATFYFTYLKKHHFSCMSTVYKILIFAFIYLLFPCISLAQKNNLRIDHLTIDDGLSHNHIFEILQDRRGFMWFATQDGLNRYDGYTFVVYKNKPDDPNTISNNFILDLIEDNQGNLWLGTIAGGVNKINPVTGHVTHYQHHPGNSNSISDNAVESIVQDSYGNFWFGTTRNGLNKFEPTTETFTRFIKDTDGKSIGKITKVIEDKRKEIWFTGERGLFHMNPRTGEITRPPATMSLLSADYIFEDDAGIFWILAWNPAALIKYNPATEQLTEYPCDAIGLWSCNLVYDRKQGFWISSKKGLCYFNKQTEKFKYLFQQDETNPDGLSDNYVSSIYRDREGLLWLGTEKGGINIVNFQKEQFGFYRNKSGNRNSLLPGRVSALHIDSGGILWLGYIPCALSRIDRKSWKTTHYIPRHGDKYSLGKGASIRSIYKDSRGCVWLGGWEAGLTRFDERSGLFKQYLPKKDDPNGLISDKIYCIMEDNNRNLWLGQYGGLSRFNPETEQFTNYLHDPANPKSLGRDIVYCTYQDHDGKIWIGSPDGVLSRFDVKNETFENYLLDPNTSKSLKGGDINVLYKSRSGILWIGVTDGLYRYNRENETFTHYSEKQGLSDNCVNGIVEDDTGILWISTLNGLSRFDPQKETFRNYDKIYGLPDNDFSEGCYGKDKNGELFFGCSKGLLAFFPGNIRNNPYIPPIVLTDFRIFGKSVPINKNSVLQQNINETNTLTLPHNLNAITFEFAALSYSAPQKKHYRYMLESFDKGWYYTDAKERLAVYTNLPVGNYMFKVQGANQDGEWNREEKSIKIIIVPPWWATWWSRGVLALLTITVIYGIFWIRLRNIRKRTKEFERLVVERTSQLQAANKELEAFAYSVSHDLRAPLRGIEGFSQILVEEYHDEVGAVAGNYLMRIRSAARRMELLIDDMLGLSRVNRTEMVKREVNLSRMAQKITDNLLENQPDREVEFVIKENIIAKADAGLIQIVLQNLIQNAWKFTSKQKVARIEFGEVIQNGKQVFLIKDNGAGFDMKYVEKLFGAFQRLHDNTEYQGTGIGLATVQRIIHRHGGKVWAEGEVEKGAIFYFTLT